MGLVFVLVLRGSGRCVHPLLVFLLIFFIFKNGIINEHFGCRGLFAQFEVSMLLIAGTVLYGHGTETENMYKDALQASGGHVETHICIQHGHPSIRSTHVILMIFLICRTT